MFCPSLAACLSRAEVAGPEPDALDELAWPSWATRMSLEADRDEGCAALFWSLSEGADEPSMTRREPDTATTALSVGESHCSRHTTVSVEEGIIRVTKLNEHGK